MTNTVIDKMVSDLLINWGRWCRDDPGNRLGYVQLPTSRGYVAPRGKKRPPSTPIDIEDAETTNAAILHIALQEWPRDDVYLCHNSVYIFIRECWAMHQNDRELTALFGCSRTTIWRRRVRAKARFWQEYQDILLTMRKFRADKVA